MLRETTSRSLCGLVGGSPHTPLPRECGGEGDYVKEGGGEKECERERGCHYATALDIEVDPQRCRFGSRKSDFALQALVEDIIAGRKEMF
jgi:hypothetical protein